MKDKDKDKESKNRVRENFLDVCFLDLAKSAASSVARVLDSESFYKGTGFMISERLFLTNNHVIGSIANALESTIEFNYEVDFKGKPKVVSRFVLAPQDFFLSSSEGDLDFTVVAVGKQVFGKRNLSEFGYCPIKDTGNNQSIGKYANIIHHPNAEFKQIVLRENQLTAFSDNFLHYVTNTTSGSSGAPVFNDKFEVIAVHHYGERSKTATTPEGIADPKNANEGIRISAIVKRIKEEKQKLDEKQQKLVNAALNCPFNLPSLLFQK